MKEPVYLRALERSDLERTHAWHNDLELYRSLVSPFFFVSHYAEDLWLERQCVFSQKDVSLAICIAESNQHIGNIYLRNIDWISRTAELGIMIGELTMRSRGYGSSALRQLLSHSFDTLNLRKISLRVLAENERAMKLYQKLGFVVEGQLRSQVFKDGVYKDLVCMGIIRE